MDMYNALKMQAEHETAELAFAYNQSAIQDLIAEVRMLLEENDSISAENSHLRDLIDQECDLVDVADSEEQPVVAPDTNQSAPAWDMPSNALPPYGSTWSQVEKPDYAGIGLSPNSVKASIRMEAAITKCVGQPMGGIVQKIDIKKPQGDCTPAGASNTASNMLQSQL